MTALAKNINPAEAKFKEGYELPVMEAFYTIQGEGVHTGKAAYFIRLAGCDVGCHWCDVKDSWQADKHPVFPIKKLVEEAEKYPSRTVVVTGGEPLMHNLEPLTSAFHHAGFRVHIETSGAHPLTGSFEWICLSPKKPKPPLSTLYPVADELKIIIYNKHDFVWGEKLAAEVPEKCVLILQPEWSKREIIMPMIVAYIKMHPLWQISLQTHKYLGIP